MADDNISDFDAIRLAKVLLILAVLGGCAAPVDEHVSKQRQVRRLEIMQPFGYLEDKLTLEKAMINCEHDAMLLQIGVATPADLPCKDDDWRIHTSSTATGTTTQYVYPGPNGDAYLYFDESGKLAAKQW